MTSAHDIPRILIVDDDSELAAMLTEYLQAEGMFVAWHASGLEVDAVIAQHQPDVLVLDVMLPGEDGHALARRLNGKLPILMVSARGADIDRILGLEFGADDYLCKPFNPRELLARVRALLRRSASAQPRTRDILHFGDFELNLAQRSLSRAGMDVGLTNAEFVLLKILVLNAGRVLSRDDLIRAADNERLPFDRSIDARVARLRKRIELDPANPRYLRTVWGAGYLFVTQP